jgi:PPM family protein phosphatase
MSILDGAQSADQRVMSIAGGTLVAYTCRSPDKETANEDTLAAFEYGEDSAVLVVADGAGGLPAGKRASLTAVSELERSLEQSKNETTLMRTAILNGIEAANRAVLDLGNGAATTLTIVGIEGRDARAYQVGDSEALIVGQRGRIRSHTMAHSPTGFAVEAGLLDQRDALHHAERHLVSNFIGTSDMRIDVGAAVTMRTHDTVLLASDGLGDNIHLHEIIEIIRKGSLQASVEQLVRLASHRMSAESGKQPSKPDDLSLMLFRKPKKPARLASAGSS